MSAEIIEVHDVPTDDVNVLRARAESRGVSLSEYLRELIHHEVGHAREPTDVEPVITAGQRAGISRSSRTGLPTVQVGRPVTTADVRALEDDQ